MSREEETRLAAEAEEIAKRQNDLHSLVLLKVIDLVLGLRVDTDTEREGLDLAIHGEVIQ